MVLVQNVSKRYRLYRRPADRLRECIPGGSPRHTTHWALRDISFQAERGEALGIIGPNGCGKSTLLQIVCGIVRPTSGRVVARGRIGAVLELGAGFNPEFTGRENVLLNGSLLGLSRAEIAAAMPGIAAFAEIGTFLDRPVKEYSSGMYVRLAFSTAVHIDPEILVVDEALAVGDAVFANRCVRKFQELRERRVTVLFVSHDLHLVNQIADRAILLWRGRTEAEGAPHDVINRYVGLALYGEARRIGKARERVGRFRHGNGSSEVTVCEMRNERGAPATTFHGGEWITVRVRARFHSAESDPIVGLIIRTRTGAEVYVTNTRMEQISLGDFEPGDELEVDFQMECRLTPQAYTLTVATAQANGMSHDWLDDAMAFEVVDRRTAAGVVNLEARIRWKKITAEPRSISIC